MPEMASSGTRRGTGKLGSQVAPRLSQVGGLETQRAGQPSRRACERGAAGHVPLHRQALRPRALAWRTRVGLVQLWGSLSDISRA